MCESNNSLTLDEIDFLLDRNFHSGIDKTFENIKDSIKKVLTNVPSKELEKIKDKIRGTHWVCFSIGAYSGKFIANITENECIENKYSIIVFLPSYFEELDKEILIATIAHELAHIALGHCGKRVSYIEDYNKDEEEARELVIKWGFKDELKKEEAFSKTHKIEYCVKHNE